MTHPRSHALSARALTLKSVALAATLAATSLAFAAENGNQRYSAGIGGSDMTTPVMPGLYFQAPMVAYHAKKIKGNDGKQLTSATPAPGVRAKVGIETDTYAVLPRLTYISTTRLLGANVGLTAMVPVVKRKADFVLTSTDP